MTRFPQHLVEHFENLRAQAAYGPPIELDGSTVLPVALVSYGFGGGAAPETSQQSSGGGGGGLVVPIGAYVTQRGTTRFRPNPLAVLAVGIPFTMVAGKAVQGILRAWKS